MYFRVTSTDLLESDALFFSGEGLPDLHSVLSHFKDAFDWVEANSSGRIIPREGVDMEFDSACEKIKEIQSSLTKHLKEQRKLLGDTSVRNLLESLLSSWYIHNTWKFHVCSNFYNSVFL